MAKKKEIDPNITELKEVLENKKAIIGTELTLKRIKQDKVSKVFLSSNCPEDVLDDINHYAKLSKFTVVRLSQPNTELGIVCKKPFSVCIVGSLR